MNVSWSEQLLLNGHILPAGSASFTFTSIGFTENTIDDCAGVNDSYGGVLGACVGDANPTTYTDDRTVPVGPHG